MKVKEAMFETLNLASSRGMKNTTGDVESVHFAHLWKMWQRVSSEEFSEGKLNRWLGWIQCAVVAGEFATLEEMKEINRRHADV